MSEHKPTVGEEWIVTSLRKPVRVEKVYKTGRVKLEGMTNQWRASIPHRTESGTIVPSLTACGQRTLSISAVVVGAVLATEETLSEHAAECARKDALEAARAAVTAEINRLRARNFALDTWLGRCWHRKGIPTQQLLDEYAALMAEPAKGATDDMQG